MPRNHNTRRGRKTNIRNERESYLLITEGECTEAQFFKILEKNYSVHTKKSKGTDAVSVVNSARKIKYQDAEGIHIWAIFDVDENPSDRLQQALNIANTEQIEVGVSNQSFELWIILHYEYMQSSLHRSQYKTILERIANDQLGCTGFVYNKSIDPFLETLENNIGTAIRNAKKLLSRNAKRLLNRNDPHRCIRTNPSTTIFFLVEEILEKAKKN